jgi:hypothetical protein
MPIHRVHLSDQDDARLKEIANATQRKPDELLDAACSDAITRYWVDNNMEPKATGVYVPQWVPCEYCNDIIHCRNEWRCERGEARF